jgi:hypothetical protein
MPTSPMQFSHAVGYRGLCSITPEDTAETVLLCTGGNITLSQEPIMSGGVWGGGYANATPIAYAYNYLSLEGSANFEWVTNDAVWYAMRKFAFTDRTKQTTVKLLPDGKNGFSGNGWCSSLSFEASEGAALTGTMNFKGDPGDPNGGIQSAPNVTTIGATDQELQWGTGGAGYWGNARHPSGFAGPTLIPYWNTQVSTEGTTSGGGTGQVPIDDVISWSCNYSSDLQVLKCCSFQKNLYDGNENPRWGAITHTPINGDYILCGEMSGDGSLTIFALRQSGAASFAPAGFHTKKKNLTFTLGFDYTDEESYATVLIPYALINSAASSMTTGASYITCDYSFNAIGDGGGPIMEMSDVHSSNTSNP